MFGVWIVSEPSVAPAGTRTFTYDGAVERTATPAAPGKSTVPVDFRPCPVIVTVAPAAADAGETPVTFVTWNAVGATTEPCGVTTVIRALETTPAGTVVEMLVPAGSALNVTPIEPNFTAVASERLAPVIVTAEPTLPSGVDEAIVGVALNLVVAIPAGSMFGVCTSSGP